MVIVCTATCLCFGAHQTPSGRSPLLSSMPQGLVHLRLRSRTHLILRGAVLWHLTPAGMKSLPGKTRCCKRDADDIFDTLTHGSQLDERVLGCLRGDATGRGGEAGCGGDQDRLEVSPAPKLQHGSSERPWASPPAKVSPFQKHCLLSVFGLRGSRSAARSPCHNPRPDT